MNAPPGLDIARLRADLREVHGIVLGGGQAELKGKIVRMGTMGELSSTDLLRGLEAFETVLREQHHPVAEGAGMRAARAVLDQELAAAR
jgi:aspartate aminotransferase-like enzyme